MAQHHPTETTGHDYLPAAGRDGLLPFYDLFTAALGVAKMHRTLVGQAGLEKGQRVLEIGCGTGNLSVLVKRVEPGVELVATDPDPLALARAQRKGRRLTGIRFERGYAQQLSYPDASFDRVFSAFMLHHLDHETKTEAAAEIRRVLRPGGSLHLADFVGHHHGIHGLLAQRVVKSGRLDDHLDDGIPRVLTAAGLECAEVAARRHPVMGQVAYYRAVRPA